MHLSAVVHFLSDPSSGIVLNVIAAVEVCVCLCVCVQKSGVRRYLDNHSGSCLRSTSCFLFCLL